MDDVIRGASTSFTVAENGSKAAPLKEEAFSSFPYGLVIFDGDGRPVVWNARAVELVGKIEHHARCCDLIGCRSQESPLGGECFTEIARARETPLPEARVDLVVEETRRSVWVTATRLSNGDATLLELRPGEPQDRRRRTQPHWLARPELRLTTLGITRVESREGELRGRWLDGRAGQILKLLVAERGRVVQTDQIVEAIWPGSDVTASDNVRYYVHVLREKIEPGRPKRSPSSFIISRQGGYVLNSQTVWVDADEFETKVSDGFRLLRRGDEPGGIELLRDGVAMYGGDFLVEDAYAPWALRERDRLRALASESLDALASFCISAGQLDAAARSMDQLSALQPFDEDVQRRVIALALARGRRSDAVRHYNALRARIRNEFGEDPGFDFSDVTADELAAAI